MSAGNFTASKTDQRRKAVEDIKFTTIKEELHTDRMNITHYNTMSNDTSLYNVTKKYFPMLTPERGLTDDILSGSGVQQQSDNQSVQTQHLGKDKNQDHTDKQSWLLGSTTDTGVTNDTDGETSSQTGQTNRETSTQLDETGVQGLLLLQGVRDKHGDDQTVDGNDTSHDNWDNVLNKQIWTEDRSGTDTDTRLCGTVCGTETCEDDGTGTTYGSKEWGVDRAGDVSISLSQQVREN